MSKADLIAVIGMSCRFPAANNPEEFWDLIAAGRSGIKSPSHARSIRYSGVMAARAGYLEHIDGFDPYFFDISAQEASAMDPRQRLALELGWEAVEHAGIAPGLLDGRNIGVYFGVSGADYIGDSPAPGNAYSATGSVSAAVANRISYTLNLMGPSIVVDSAQSSSLVAVLMACDSLRSSDLEMAIVGGVNLIDSHRQLKMWDDLGVLSPDGECYAFDSRANGFVPGEGGGVVVLKRYDAAIADGDAIYAIINGGATNHNGLSSSLASPNAKAQEELIRMALMNADVSASEIQFVEAHGTGTSAGDLAEARGLSAAIGKVEGRSHPVLVGSVKTNIGHLGSASGIAGLIKVILSIAHGTVPLSRNFIASNHGLDLKEMGLHVPDIGADLANLQGRVPIRAGVSSFGMAGSNCHLILSEPMSNLSSLDGVRSSVGGPVAWMVSGRTREALVGQAQRLREFVSQHPE
ncbi:polyketide synthase, partial [Nocardia asteroides]|uniref:polyketide synthase n=1 Tax=Nocardia asteroides TaxID=1824 RepID=UPI003442C49E